MKKDMMDNKKSDSPSAVNPSKLENRCKSTFVKKTTLLFGPI